MTGLRVLWSQHTTATLSRMREIPAARNLGGPQSARALSVAVPVIVAVATATI